MASNALLFPCNTCSVAFATSELQRSHMREPCHVNNIKRRMVQLPALNPEQFEAELKHDKLTHPLDETNSNPENEEPSEDPSESSSSSSDGEEEPNHLIPPSQCLFCNLASPTTATNLSHMQTTHGLFIPSPTHLPSPEALLTHLATTIHTHITCLFCGAQRSSLEGIQTHMRAKGHCMINLDRSAELLDFWALSDSDDDDDDDEKKDEAAMHLSHDEMRLPSGATIAARAPTAQLRSKPALAHSRRRAAQLRAKRDTTSVLAIGDADAGAEAQSPGTARAEGEDRRVAVRGELGVVGLSDGQRRALAVVEKKSRKREVVARAAQRWAVERVANKQKFFKPDVPGPRNG